MKLTENFNLSDFTDSETAQKNNILNFPGAMQTLYLQKLCADILEPLQKEVKKPIKINSGFRCEKLNSLVGGSSTSQHKFGQAADIVIDGLTPKKVFDLIVKLDLPFHQLINEFDSWVHVSISPDSKPPKKEKLKAEKKDGKTIYIGVK